MLLKKSPNIRPMKTQQEIQDRLEKIEKEIEELQDELIQKGLTIHQKHDIIVEYNELKGERYGILWVIGKVKEPK